MKTVLKFLNYDNVKYPLLVNYSFQFAGDDEGQTVAIKKQINVIGITTLIFTTWLKFILVETGAVAMVF